MSDLDVRVPSARTLPKKVDDPDLEALRISLSSRPGSKVFNRDFDWSDCFARLARLPRLAQLFVRECHLQALPEVVGQLRALRELDLSHNDLASLPDELFDLDLETLTLCGNPLEAVPSSLGNAKRLSRLDISGTRVPSSRCPSGPLQIPASIGDLIALEELDLTVNNLTMLPRRFSELRALRRLDLGSNRFTTFPEPLAMLSRLEWLRLGGGIGQLDVDLGEMTSLRHLDVAIVADLPALRTLPALEELRVLVGTEVRTLPATLVMLGTLRSLWLSTDLVELPPEIGELAALEQLELRGKSLATLPDALARLTRLRRLDVRGLPLDTPPPVLANLSGLDLLCLDPTRIDAWGETLRAWLPSTELWPGEIDGALRRRRIQPRR